MPRARLRVRERENLVAASRLRLYTGRSPQNSQFITFGPAHCKYVPFFLRTSLDSHNRFLFVLAIGRYSGRSPPSIPKRSPSNQLCSQLLLRPLFRNQIRNTRLALLDSSALSLCGCCKAVALLVGRALRTLASLPPAAAAATPHAARLVRARLVRAARGRSTAFTGACILAESRIRIGNTLCVAARHVLSHK